MVARTLLAMSVALGVAGCGGTADSEADTLSPTASAAAPVTATPTAPAGRGEAQRGRVVYVSDGDTVGVRLSGSVRRIRLVGIDAPETKDPDGVTECYGPQAAARALRLMPRGSVVTVVTDPTQDRVDRFGRLLAYVFPVNEPRSVNVQLVADGAAKVYVYRRNRPPKRIRELRDAESAARTANRGLWGTCPS